jgi:integrase
MAIQRNRAALTAILGTVVFDALTIDPLWDAMSRLRREDLDLGARVVTVVVSTTISGATGASAQLRLPIDVRTALLFARLLRLDARVSHDRRRDRPLFASGEYDATRLRAAAVALVAAYGFGTWRRFVGTVQLASLLGAHPPLTIGRRSGRLIVASARSADWRRAAWILPDALDRQAGQDTGRVPEALPLPDPSSRLYAVHRVAVELDGQADPPLRQAVACRLELLARDPVWIAQARGAAWPIREWAVHLLRGIRQYRPNTVRTWLMRLTRLGGTGLFDELVDNAAVLDGTPVVRRALASCRSLETQLATRTAIRQFLTFAARQGHTTARVDWWLASLGVENWMRPTAILMPGEIRAAAMQLHASGDDGPALAVATVLAGLGGLRRTEVCQLEVIDVPRDCRWTVRVRHSKTQAGRRWIPLGLLAPKWAFDLLERYATERSSRLPASAWLLDRKGNPWDPDVLAARVTRVLRRVAGRSVSFHALRRSCATWWFIRWFEAMGYGVVPAALDPEGPPKAGVLEVLGEDPVIVLWSLARLLGHSSPVVTLGRYGPAVEWIESQRAAPSTEVKVPARVAADILGVGERWARQLATFRRNEVRGGESACGRRSPPGRAGA